MNPNRTNTFTLLFSVFSWGTCKLPVHVVGVSCSLWEAPLPYTVAKCVVQVKYTMSTCSLCLSFSAERDIYSFKPIVFLNILPFHIKSYMPLYGRRPEVIFKEADGSPLSEGNPQVHVNRNLVPTQHCLKSHFRHCYMYSQIICVVNNRSTLNFSQIIHHATFMGAASFVCCFNIVSCTFPLQSTSSHCIVI